MRFACKFGCLLLAALLIFSGPVEAMALAQGIYPLAEETPESEADGPGESMEAANGERTRQSQRDDWERASLDWLLVLALGLPMLITAALLAAMNGRKR